MFTYSSKLLAIYRVFRLTGNGLVQVPSKFSLRGIQTIFLDGLLPVDGLPFEEFIPSFFVSDFELGEEERVLAPRLLVVV